MFLDNVLLSVKKIQGNKDNAQAHAPEHFIQSSSLSAYIKDVNNSSPINVQKAQEANKSPINISFWLISFGVVALIILAFIRFRLYKANKLKTLRLANKTRELKQEIKNNEALTGLLNSIFESSLNGIIAFASMRDEQGQIIDFKYQMANQSAAKMIGVDLEKLLNNTMLNVLPGNKETGLFSEYVNTVATGKPFYTIIHYNLDELDKWFSISAVKNQDGFIVTFSDISELKRNEVLLLKKQHELEEANQELEQFAYIASHDLQEPLRKIRAFGDRLEANYGDLLDHKGKDFIARMRSASARMQTLIDDLLMFSRATKGNTNMLELDLNKVLKIVQELLCESIEDKHAKISIPILPIIKANESQMIQLFQNIISNALKYVPINTAPDIVFKLSETVIDVNKVPTEFWQISITDNGIGFDEVHKDKIFEIFQRLHGRAEYSGTGIGLAICLKIVTNHNGFISAHSEQNQGATFIVHLPKISECVSRAED